MSTYTIPETAAPPPWPHQVRFPRQLAEAREAGHRRICVASPTGGGKTRMMADMAQEEVSQYRKVVIYSNRKLLTSQTSGVLEGHGVSHGVMAAGHAPALLRDIQVASIQTIESRVFNRERWNLHEAATVIIDEAHANKAETVQKIVRQHREQDATIIGFTATPVGIDHLYDHLITAGTNSELRECGALVKCTTYGPDEPDLRHIGPVKVGEFSEEQRRKAIMRPGVFGRVWDNWRRLNPDGRPTILFAPDVPGSRYFAAEFAKRGVAAGHIDAETPDDLRQEFLEGSREGRVNVLCNRFVLREGIDAPWLAHCILATMFGGLSGFLQAGGRLLRAYPGIDEVTLQDHGGSWWRHGSLNQDRQWKLEDTDVSIARATRIRREHGKEAEPITCPKCGGIRRTGPVCPFCGHRSPKSVRMVVQSKGTLKAMTGPVVKEKKQRPPREKALAWWRDQVWAGYRGKGKTFAQCRAAYQYNHRGQVPPLDFPCLPPPDSINWTRKVSAVYSKQEIYRAFAEAAERGEG